MSEWKEGDIVEIGGKLMVCVPHRTKGAVYRDGAYWLYTEKSPKVRLTPKNLQYFREEGKRLRKERKIYNRNQPVHISDNYGEKEMLIGGRHWWLTEHVTAPVKEAGKDVSYAARSAVGGVAKTVSGAGGIKRSAQLVAIVMMAFIGLLIYIIFVKGRGAQGVTVVGK